MPRPHSKFPCGRLALGPRVSGPYQGRNRRPAACIQENAHFELPRVAFRKNRRVLPRRSCRISAMYFGVYSKATRGIALFFGIHMSDPVRLCHQVDRARATKNEIRRHLPPQNRNNMKKPYSVTEFADPGDREIARKNKSAPWPKHATVSRRLRNMGRPWRRARRKFVLSEEHGEYEAAVRRCVQGGRGVA